MIITIQQLEERNACKEARIAFRDAVGEKTADIEWNPAAQGWLLADPIWRRWFGWAYRNGLLPLWSLSGADLSEANLRWADLRRATWNEYTIWTQGFEPRAS